MKADKPAFLCLFVPFLLFAQVGVRLYSPPPWQTKVEHLWHVDVNNQAGEAIKGAWFEGEVREAQAGRVYWAKTKPFDLAPGRTTFRLNDIRFETQDYKAGYEAFYLRKGSIPDGSYSWRLVLMPSRDGDSVSVTVREPGPPRLIFPPDGATLTGKYPQFSWTRPMPPAGKMTYRLRLVEVLPGQGPEEAMQLNAPWFEQDGIPSQTVRYPSSARGLEPGLFGAGTVHVTGDGKPGGKTGEYVWRVEAISGDKVIGTSDMRRFRFQPEDSSRCRCSITDIFVNGAAVEPWTGTTMRNRSAGIEVEFRAECDGPGCEVRSHFWRVAEASDHDLNVGMGTGNDFTIPSLGAPREYVLFLTAYCNDGSSQTAWVELDITR